MKRPTWTRLLRCFARDRSQNLVAEIRWMGEVSYHDQEDIKRWWRCLFLSKGHGHETHWQRFFFTETSTTWKKILTRIPVFELSRLVSIMTHQSTLTRTDVLPKTNTAPTKPLGNYFPFGRAYVQERTVSFREGRWWHDRNCLREDRAQKNDTSGSRAENIILEMMIYLATTGTWVAVLFLE